MNKEKQRNYIFFYQFVVIVSKKKSTNLPAKTIFEFFPADIKNLTREWFLLVHVGIHVTYKMYVLEKKHDF